jgi:hypothetical protein
MRLWFATAAAVLALGGAALAQGEDKPPANEEYALYYGDNGSGRDAFSVGFAAVGENRTVLAFRMELAPQCAWNQGRDLAIRTEDAVSVIGRDPIEDMDAFIASRGELFDRYARARGAPASAGDRDCFTALVRAMAGPRNN